MYIYFFNQSEINYLSATSCHSSLCTYTVLLIFGKRGSKSRTFFASEVLKMERRYQRRGKRNESLVMVRMKCRNDIGTRECHMVHT